MSPPDESPSPAAPPPRPPRAGGGLGTREVVLGWCLWLIGSWVLVLGAAGGIPAAGPTHRWMSFMAAIGVTAVWPALRLSQEARDRRGRPTDAPLSRGAVLLDWVALNLVFQAVLWPMAFVGGWSLPQALLLGGTIAAWSLLAGLIVAWGRAFDRGSARTAAMGGCLAVLLLEPLVLLAAVVARGGGWGGLPDLRLSPLQAVFAYSGPAARFAHADPAFASRVLGVGAAAVLGWVIFLLAGPRGGPGR
ncbi:hypothetical protein [Phycisphaera mikurensis]|uniref:Uncharacterized protein n=1 Tax=Phycisphaera mikurensis (strain NBRC 102666 / KCTC 22515 / FYK2301M01) TaxID=1142394 RepID=I0IAJ0_PHYMF|nr:hypothetical protein [Phycisphaera mikurensis]MBB6441725.1 hypothetical protein [Phycisphaera mikurensis]BAM02278.1 hypothetical protein PSMK_01190 [Phycisphaera mikurensis NBRC 102666]